MTEAEGKIVILDFGTACFLPPSFFVFALFRKDTILIQLIAKKVQHLKSTQLNAMLTASYGLVPYQNNEISVRGLKPRLSKHGAQAVPRSTGLRPFSKSLLPTGPYCCDLPILFLILMCL